MTAGLSQRGWDKRGERFRKSRFLIFGCRFPAVEWNAAVIWKLPDRTIEFPRRPLVMGIVNVNDDSFSGDGTLEIDAALAQARRQAEQGADVIDVGAESARTNRSAVPVDEEVRRFREFLARWPEQVAAARPMDSAQVWPPVLSANTWRPEVVAAVLPWGVELVNDMGGLPDDRNARLRRAGRAPGARRRPAPLGGPGRGGPAPDPPAPRARPRATRG